MQIKFSDNTTLDVLNVNGQSDGFSGPQSINYQGMVRDSLTFEFDPAVYTFDQIRAATGDEFKTDAITVIAPGGSFLHEHYNLRKEISQRPVTIAPDTGAMEGTFQERLIVTMVQENRFETNLKSVRNDVDNVQIEMLAKEGIL